MQILLNCVGSREKQQFSSYEKAASAIQQHQMSISAIHVKEKKQKILVPGLGKPAHVPGSFPALASLPITERGSRPGISCCPLQTARGHIKHAHCPSLDRAEPDQHQASKRLCGPVCEYRSRSCAPQCTRPHPVCEVRYHGHVSFKTYPGKHSFLAETCHASIGPAMTFNTFQGALAGRVTRHRNRQGAGVLYDLSDRCVQSDARVL